MIRSIPLIAALASALVAGIASAQGGAPAGDAAKGREKVQMCQGCHGIDGWRAAFGASWNPTLRRHVDAGRP